MFGASKRRIAELEAENARVKAQKAAIARRFESELSVVKDDNAELSKALRDRNVELIKVRGEKATIGKALNEALAELAPLKAQRETALANLRAANEARRRKAGNGVATGVGAA